MRAPATFVLLFAGCASAPAPAPTAPAQAPAAAAPVESATPTASASGAVTPTAPTIAPASEPPPPAKQAAGVVFIGDIEAPKTFDPRPTLKSLEPKFTACYKTALAANPSVHGRLKIRFVVFESGKVDTAEDAGKSSMTDAALAQCVFDAIKAATFPKPGGTATVTFPLSFR